MKKKAAVIVISLAVMASVAYFLWPKADPMKDIAKKYDLISVRKMDLSETVEVTGNVYAREKKEIYSDFDGIVKTVVVKAGDEVKKGDVLFTMESSTLKDQWDAANTSLKQAKLNLAKAKVQLSTELAINKVSTDNALQLESFTHEIGLYKEQVKQAEQQLATLEAKNDGRYQNGILTIGAPFSGQVAWMNVKQGDKVISQNQVALATIMKPDSLGVEADIDQNDIGLIQTGQTVTIVGKDARQTENIGSVREISTQGEASDEVVNFPVRMEVTGKPQGLQPGMSVDVTIVAKEYPGVLTVPAAGVIEKNGRTSVNVYRGGRIVPVAITLGYQQGKYWQVLSGLRVGDKVAVSKPVLVSKNTGIGQQHQPMGPFGR